MIDQSGRLRSFAEGLKDPKGLDAWQGSLFVTDKTRVLRVRDGGGSTMVADAEDFPRTLQFLNDLEIDRQGKLYVSDSGNGQGAGGAVYRLNLRGHITEIKLHEPDLGTPNGLLMQGSDHVLMVDMASGNLYRLAVNSGKADKLSGGYIGGGGLARDMRGRLYVSSWKTGRIFVLDSPQSAPRQLTDTFKSADYSHSAGPQASSRARYAGRGGSFFALT
jgi:sugar lactone lactonase YvrE